MTESLNQAEYCPKCGGPKEDTGSGVCWDCSSSPSFNQDMSLAEKLERSMERLRGQVKHFQLQAFNMRCILETLRKDPDFCDYLSVEMMDDINEFLNTAPTKNPLQSEKEVLQSQVIGLREALRWIAESEECRHNHFACRYTAKKALSFTPTPDYSERICQKERERLAGQIEFNATEYLPAQLRAEWLIIAEYIRSGLDLDTFCEQKCAEEEAQEKEGV